MALITADAPAGGFRTVQDALTRTFPRPERMAAALREAGAEDVAVSVPHPVYGAGLEDVVRGRITQGAQLHGWRYLLVGGNQAVGAAEVSAEDEGGEVGFSHFNHGPFVGATMDGLGAAEALEEVKGGDFEVRLLRVPALYLMALWLHGGEDLFIPLPPVPAGLVAMRPYREAELVEAVRETAAQRLSFDDRPEAAPPR